MTVNKKTRPRGFFLYLIVRNPQKPAVMNDLEKVIIVLRQRGYERLFEYENEIHTISFYRQNVRSVIIFIKKNPKRFDLYFQSACYLYEDLIKEIERFETHEVDPYRRGYTY